MCAALIASDAAEEIRAELSTLKEPGQIKLHWTDEKESRRRKIVELVSGIESILFVVSHKASPQNKTERFRKECLKLLYSYLTDYGVTNLILESRSVVQDREDKRHIVHLQQRGSYVGLHIEHKRGGECRS